MPKLPSLFSLQKKERYKAARGQKKSHDERLPDLDVSEYDDEGILKLDKTGLSSEDLEELHDSFEEISHIPIIKDGHVEHGYSLKVVADSEHCPRCNGPMQQHYANFIYATNIAPRDMFAPAGYFCTQCPTVIVDEEMVAAGIRGNFKFQGVVGVYYTDPEEPDLFATWNGKKSLYYFDEHEQVMGLSGLPDSMHSSTSNSKKHRSANRRKMQKQSRKKNRRKK